MADLKGYMQPGHTVEDLDTVIDEVYEARGEYDSLDERLDDMEGGAPTPSTSIPAMDGTGSAGTSSQYARADHVHPSDTSKQNALTTAQLAAVNSGIDSIKVEQIETNKNNILKQQGATAQGGNGYAIINGKRLYMADTEPTNQRIGDVWIYDRLYTYTPILVNSPLYGTKAHKDSIDLSTGTITRKIRKLTLDSSIHFDGPEAIPGGYRYGVSNVMTNPILSERAEWKCSHLAYTRDWENLGFVGGVSSNTVFIMINIDTIDGLKAWLDAQIAANTPVIIYYSSLTDTTETITIPTGLTGTATGTMEQSGTPQPDSPIYPTGNNVAIWH